MGDCLNSAADGHYCEPHSPEPVGGADSTAPLCPAFRGRGIKRRPAVTVSLALVYAAISKAEFAEAALSLAAACSDGGCDDLEAGTTRLIEEINLGRERRGASPINREARL